MKEYRYSLEKYKGSKTRQECPNCRKRRSFALYIDNETGDPVHDSVGRCNREDRCGYHVTPKSYFKENGIEHNEEWESDPRADKEELPQISVEPLMLQKSLTSYENNNFVKYLVFLFGWSDASKLVSRYFIGSSKHWNNAGANVFWQIDSAGNIRTGKIMLYNADTGKRVKQPFNHIHWVHALTNLPGELKQCFFGEHLLRDEQKTVAIVESEKTAVIASMYFPNSIWLACGGLSMLNYEKCLALKNRNVVLYPDLNGYDKWVEKVELFLPKICATYSVSNLVEKVATLEEKASGLDLADYLVRYNLADFPDSPAPAIAEPMDTEASRLQAKQELTEALNDLVENLTEGMPATIDGIEYPCFKSVVNMILQGWSEESDSEYFQDRIREIYHIMHLNGFTQFENKY